MRFWFVAAIALATAVHFGYGATWAGILAGSTPQFAAWKGIALGGFLWVVLQLCALPLIGWGFFGVAITETLWLETLLEHLIYGISAGLLIERALRRPIPPRLKIRASTT